MALNLVSFTGKPNFYHNLPNGWSNLLDSLGIGSYLCTFTASSASSKIIKFDTGNSNNLINTDTNLTGMNSPITLTPIPTQYTFRFKLTAAGVFQMYNANSSSDIVIDNLVVVQAPLPKKTINGIDGFLSGKWSLPSGFTVIDDSNLSLNTNINWTQATLYVPCLPNTTYTFTCNNSANRIECDECDINKTVGTHHSSSSGNSVTFTTGNNTYYLMCVLGNATTNGQFTFSQPMLNLGSIPAPYEKKRGDTMVLPTAKKNLLPPISQWIDNTVGKGQIFSDYSCQININANGGYFYRYYVSVLPNTTYFFSGNFSSGTTVYMYNNDSSKTRIGNSVNAGNSITTTSNTSFLECLMNVVIGTVTPTFSNWQLEQGTTASPFTPYAVQVNPKPKRLVPKKNLFDGALVAGYLNGSTFVSGGAFLLTNDFIKIQPNTVYSISTNGGLWDKSLGGYRISWFDNYQTYISNSTDSSQPSPSNAYYAKFHWSTSVFGTNGNGVQFEQGTATPFEPYQLVLPSAQRGLVVNPTLVANDWVDCGSFVPYPTFSVEVRFKSSMLAYQQPVSQQGTLNSDSGWTIKLRNNGDIWFRVGSELGHYDATAVGAYSVGEDITLRCTYDGTNLNMFKNGTLIGSFVGSKSFMTSPSPFYIGKGTSISEHFNGTINYVKLWDGQGNLIRYYDFTNPRTVTGTTVLGNGNQNLLPSFDSGQWTIHPNAKVLGRDVLHLDATGLYQSSMVNIPFSGNTRLLALNTICANIWEYDASGTQIKGTAIGNGGILTTQPTTVKTQLELTNSVPTGSFDFIQPQLFQLNGNEGTISGTPVQLYKPSKRNLYSKR